LNNCVASYPSFSLSSNSTLVALNTLVHNDIRSIRNAVNSYLTKTNFVTLNLGSAALSNFYTRSHNVSNLHSKNQLASTFTLYKNTDNCAILYDRVLNNNFIVWLSTCENGTSTKLSEGTVRHMDICMNSNKCRIMISFITIHFAAV